MEEEVGMTHKGRWLVATKLKPSAMAAMINPFASGTTTSSFTLKLIVFICCVVFFY